MLSLVDINALICFVNVANVMQRDVQHVIFKIVPTDLLKWFVYRVCGSAGGLGLPGAGLGPRLGQCLGHPG